MQESPFVAVAWAIPANELGHLLGRHFAGPQRNPAACRSKEVQADDIGAAELPAKKPPSATVIRSVDRHPVASSPIDSFGVTTGKRLQYRHELALIFDHGCLLPARTALAFPDFRARWLHRQRHACGLAGPPGSLSGRPEIAERVGVDRHPDRRRESRHGRRTGRSHHLSLPRPRPVPGPRPPLTADARPVSRRDRWPPARWRPWC